MSKLESFSNNRETQIDTLSRLLWNARICGHSIPYSEGSWLENINESYFGSALSIYEDNILIGNYNGEKSHIYQISNLSPKLIKSLIPPQNIVFGKFGSNPPPLSQTES